MRRPARPKALPGRGDGARIAVQHRHIERADIDPKLQRRGADHGIDAPGAQGLLSIASLARQIAAAIGEHPRRSARVAIEDVFEVLGDHLDHQPRAREDDVLQPGLGRHPRDAGGLRARRGADAEVRIDHRRIPQQQMALALRRAAVGDRHHRRADQPLGQLGRIGDGRRGEDELRPDPIELADPLQPAEDISDVRAEHTTVAVQFVDDDERQRLEELRPLGVMRQDRLVQHVRVRDHDIAARAHRLARIARGVAVEGEGLDAEGGRCRSAGQRAASDAGAARSAWRQAPALWRRSVRQPGSAPSARRPDPAPAPWSGTGTAP